MIRKILTYYAERLEEYLSRFHRRPEGLATVGMIGNSAEERPNKMVVSLLNVERETAGGITAPVQRTADGGYARLQPPLLLNLNVMLAAVFDERQYDESLSLLSDTLGFIQSTPKFEVDGTSRTSARACTCCSAPRPASGSAATTTAAHCAATPSSRSPRNY